MLGPRPQSCITVELSAVNIGLAAEMTDQKLCYLLLSTPSFMSFLCLIDLLTERIQIVTRRIGGLEINCHITVLRFVVIRRVGGLETLPVSSMCS